MPDSATIEQEYLVAHHPRTLMQNEAERYYQDWVKQQSSQPQQQQAQPQPQPQQPSPKALSEVSHPKAAGGGGGFETPAPKPPNKFAQGFIQGWRDIVGAGEAGAQLAGGFVDFLNMVPGWKGIFEGITDPEGKGHLQAATEAIQKAREETAPYFIYQPRTPEGKQAAQTIQGVLDFLITHPAQKWGDLAQTSIGEIGGPTAGSIAGVATETGLTLAAYAVLFGGGGKATKGVLNKIRAGEPLTPKQAARFEAQMKDIADTMQPEEKTGARDFTPEEEARELQRLRGLPAVAKQEPTGQATGLPLFTGTADVTSPPAQPLAIPRQTGVIEAPASSIPQPKALAAPLVTLRSGGFTVEDMKAIYDRLKARFGDKVPWPFAGGTPGEAPGEEGRIFSPSEKAKILEELRKYPKHRNFFEWMLTNKEAPLPNSDQVNLFEDLLMGREPDFSGRSSRGGGETGEAPEKGAKPGGKNVWVPEPNIPLNVEEQTRITETLQNADRIAVKLAGGTPEEVPKELAHFRILREDPLEAAKAIASNFGDLIDARRKTRTLDTTAEDLGMTAQELMNTEIGQTFNEKEMWAASSIVSSMDEQMRESARNLAINPSTENRIDFATKLTGAYATLSRFIGARSEAGRALRIGREIAQARPEYLKDLTNLLKEVGSGAPLEEIAARFNSITSLKGRMKFIQEAWKATTVDKLMEVWYQFLLSNPATPMRIAETTALHGLWHISTDLLSSEYQRIPAAIKGVPRGLTEGDIIAGTRAMLGSFKDALRLAGGAIKTGEIDREFYDMPKREAITAEDLQTIAQKFHLPFNPNSGYARALELLGHISSRSVMASHWLLRPVARSYALNKWAHATARVEAVTENLTPEQEASRYVDYVENPPRALLDKAIDEEKYITFLSEPGKAGRAFQRILREIPALKIIVPFYRIQSNLIKIASLNTPLGFLSRRVRADIASGGTAGPYALARITLGSLLMMTVMEAFSKGYITGGGPADPRERANWIKTGWQPYSFHLGGKYQSYNPLEPLSMIAGIAADTAEIAKFAREEGDIEKAAAASVMAFFKDVTSRSWMTGVSNAIEMLHEPERFGKQWLERMAVSFSVPTGVAHLKKEIDPIKRETRGMLDAIKAHIPGLSATLPPNVNFWGQPISEFQQEIPFIPVDMLNPYTVSREKHSPLDDEFMKQRFRFGMPPKVIDGVKLTDDEHHRYKVLAGNAAKDPRSGLGLRDTLKTVIETDQYKNASEGPGGLKELIVRDYIEHFREISKAQLMQEFPDLRNRITQKKVERAIKLRTPAAAGAGAIQ